MRQAGRYLPEYRALRAKAPDFLAFCYSPAMAVEATLQPIRRYGFDAAILFSDILVVPHALGVGVAFKEGEGPVLDPIRDAGGVAALKPGRVRGFLAPVYEAVASLRAKLPAETALIGFAGAPWTVASYVVEGGSSRDYRQAKQWMWRDPAGFAALIDLIVGATIEHLSAQAEAGAEALQVFDSWAGTLAEPEFRRWSIVPTRRIVDGVRARHPGVKIIGFPRGQSGAALLEYAVDSGVDAVSLDTAGADLDGVQVQGLKPVQGRLDPILLVSGGEALRRRTREILSAFRRGAHVFNLGHGIVPETPPEHVAELVALVRGSGR
jgi:uroporphyrinogen decarboxylase